MSERNVILQRVTNERTRPPIGLRIWSDGVVQHTADNPPPGETDLLDRDRELAWQDERQLTGEQVGAIKNAVNEVGFFDLPPRLLINYCKEDPGTAIWTVNVDGRTARVVVYDPRPRRSAELDRLTAVLDEILTKSVG